MVQESLLLEKSSQSVHTLDYLKVFNSFQELHLNQMSKFLYSMGNNKMMANQTYKANNKTDPKTLDRKQDYISFLKEIRDKMVEYSPQIPDSVELTPLKKLEARKIKRDANVNLDVIVEENSALFKFKEKN